MAATAVAGGAIDPTTRYIASALTTAPQVFGLPFIANLPAFLIVAALTVVLVIGIRESANSNNAIVLLKIGIILFFCAVGSTLIRPENWNNPATGGFAPNGFAGISAGAAIIFFSYIGFDATSTAAEEAKDPARDMPFGIIMSLVVCTVLYIVLALVMTGMAPWQKLGTPEPMITALALADGSPRLLAASRLIVSLGAVITGLFVATFAAFANIAEVVDLTNIGTLFAFVLVSAGVIVLRRAEPNRVRPFRAPLVPITPMISIAACLYLMLQLPRLTWIRFGVWLAIGLLIYFFYGIRNSRLRRVHPEPNPGR